MRARLVLDSFRLNVIIKKHKYILTKIHWYQREVLVNNSENAIMKYILFGIRKIAGVDRFSSGGRQMLLPTSQPPSLKFRKKSLPCTEVGRPTFFLFLIEYT